MVAILPVSACTVGFHSIAAIIFQHVIGGDRSRSPGMVSGGPGPGLVGTVRNFSCYGKYYI